MNFFRKHIALFIFAASAAALLFTAAHRAEAATITIYESHPISSLTSRQKQIASSIMAQVRKASKETVTLNYNCSETDFMKVWKAIDNSYFRYYSAIHLKAWRRYNLRTGATVGVKVKLYAKDSKKRYNRHLSNKSKLKSIAKSITKGKSTERAKVIAINNYVCSKLTYRENTGTLDVALRTSYAKCTGYATLFMALCEQCGIKCCQVAGRVQTYKYGMYVSEGHDWNQVRVGGIWYYVDPTWNDQTGNKYLLSSSLWSGREIWSKMYIINFKSCGYKFDM